MKTSEKLMASVADADRAEPVVQTTIDVSQLPDDAGSRRLGRQ